MVNNYRDEGEGLVEKVTFFAHKKAVVKFFMHTSLNGGYLILVTYPLLSVTWAENSVVFCVKNLAPLFTTQKDMTFPLSTKASSL